MMVGMSQEGMKEAALATFQIATGCEDHRDDTIIEAELGDVVYYGDNGDDEFMSVAVFKSSDGNSFIVAIESSDYSGHGCQCSGSAQRFASLDAALRLGLGDDEADLCGAVEARNAAIERFTTNLT